MASRAVRLIRRLSNFHPNREAIVVCTGARRALVSAQAGRSSGILPRGVTEVREYVVRGSLRRNSSSVQQPESKDVSRQGTTAVAGSDHLALAKPLDFDVASKVDGQESQMVTFELEPGQVIRAEAGNLIFMEDGIEMDTNTGGGLGSMFRRVITGQNMFITDYINRGVRNSKVGLGTDVPSKILRLSLADYGGSIVCQRGAFLAGSHTIEIKTEFTKMMAGFFGGEGFILQRLTGDGDAFVKASGPLIQRELKEGETLRVSSGSVVAFSPTVQYDVQTLPGFKNVVFGGEGFFITSLTGPGMVYLQGLPFDRMVDQIARRIPGGNGAMGMPIPIGNGGGGGGGPEGAGEAGADAGAGAEAAGEGTAAGEEAPTMNAESASEPSNSSEGLFGDAAPSSGTEQAAGSDTFSGGGDAAGGWNEPDRAFTEPPPDAGGSGEETWKEDSFGSAGDAPDGGGDLGDLGDMAGGEGASGVIETLKKLYTFFGGGGD